MVDLRQYPKDWKLRSHFVRFIRAKGRCEMCGAKHGSINRRTGKTIKLSCAHLRHDPKYSSLLDLMSACGFCHNRYDWKFKKSRQAINVFINSKAYLLPFYAVYNPEKETCGNKNVLLP